MRLGPALLLLVALVPLAWMWWGPRRPVEAGSRYRRLTGAQWRRFGLPPIVLLGLTRRWSGFVTLPPEFVVAQQRLGIDAFGPDDRCTLTVACLIGLGLGGALMLAVTAWRAWRGRGDGAMFGDARALIPSDSRDAGWAAAVAVSAGVTEEAYFRLLLPLLATLAFGSAIAAFAGAALLFGAAHRYQGWRGVAATTVAGGGLTLAYLATASLPLVMAIHAGGDLVHFVARPALRRWVERRRGGRGRYREGR